MRIDDLNNEKISAKYDNELNVYRYISMEYKRLNSTIFDEYLSTTIDYYFKISRSIKRNIDSKEKDVDKIFKKFINRYLCRFL